MMPFVTLLVALAAAPGLDPSAVEAHARTLEAKLIAPCCWSQQVSVHQSPAADEIRRDLRRRLARGETEQQILADYEVQFGERIFAEPPAKGFTRFLYVLPPVVLVAGAGLVVVLVRRFTGRQAEEPRAPADAPVDAKGYGEQLDEELRNLD